MQLTYAPNEPGLFLLREKPEDPNFSPMSGSRWRRGWYLPPLYLWVFGKSNIICFRYKCGCLCSYLRNGSAICLYIDDITMSLLCLHVWSEQQRMLSSVLGTGCCYLWGTKEECLFSRFLMGHGKYHFEDCLHYLYSKGIQPCMTRGFQNISPPWEFLHPFLPSNQDFFEHKKWPLNAPNRIKKRTLFLENFLTPYLDSWDSRLASRHNSRISYVPYSFRVRVGD